MAGTNANANNRIQDMVADSEVDWDQETNSESGDGMFDMFTARVNTNVEGGDGILSMDAYHRELEREFGEGRGDEEVLSGNARTRWEEDDEERETRDVSGLDDPNYDQDVELQQALFASNAKAWKADRKERRAKVKAGSVGPVGATTISDLPIRTKGMDHSEKDLAMAPTPVPSTNKSTYVSTEAVDDEVELITVHGANADVIQDQRFPYLHTEEALKNLSAYVSRDGDDFDTDAYRYTPLLISTAIRTIDILPAKTLQEPIRCRMHTIDLDGLPTRPKEYYQTVSYVWGETDDQGTHLTHTIRIDGQTLRITANLHAALQKIRGHLDAGRLTIYGRRATLWADAICINQLDLRERSHQVGLMEQIYANSTRVLVWLGNSGVGLDKQVASAIDERVWEQRTDANRLSQELMKAARWIVGRPWFSRRWIIPEFALQRVRSVLFGDYAVDFRAFAFLMQAAGLSDLTGPMKYANLWDGIRTKRWLLANLQRFRGAKCSVDHDLLYALRGISCGCGHARSICDRLDCLSWLTVAYRLAVDELFVKIARHAAQTDAMAVLACAAIRPLTEGSSKLPSWVPDWRKALSASVHVKTSIFIDDCLVEYNESYASASFYYDNIHLWADKNENPQSDVHIDDRDSSPRLTLNAWLFEYIGPSEDKSLFKQMHPSTDRRYLVPNPHVTIDDFEESDDGTETRKTKSVPAIRSTSAKLEKFAVDFDQAFPSGVENEVLILVPWSRMAFSMRRKRDVDSEHMCFVLGSCFRRPIVLGNGTFEWVRGAEGRAWMVGDLSQPLHRICIV